MFCVPPGLVWTKEGEAVIWFSVWGTTLDDWANGGSVEVSVHMVRIVLVVWVVDVILGNGYGIWGQSYVWLLHGSEMS